MIDPITQYILELNNEEQRKEYMRKERSKLEKEIAKTEKWYDHFCSGKRYKIEKGSILEEQCRHTRETLKELRKNRLVMRAAFATVRGAGKVIGAFSRKK